MLETQADTPLPGNGQKTQSSARVERYRDKAGKTGRVRLEGYVDGVIAERFLSYKKACSFNNNGETLDDLLLTVFTIQDHPLLRGKQAPVAILEDLAVRNKKLQRFLETQARAISDLLHEQSQPREFE